MDVGVIFKKLTADRCRCLLGVGCQQAVVAKSKLLPWVERPGRKAMRCSVKKLAAKRLHEEAVRLEMTLLIPSLGERRD